MDDPEVRYFFAEKFRELQSADHISTLSSGLPELVAELKSSDMFSVAAAVAALLSMVNLHPNAFRLEVLAHLACLHAAGKAKPHSADLHRWLNVHLKESIACHMEDPIQDVFVSNVITSRGNCRILNGTWENPDYWTQEVVDVLGTAPDTADFTRLRAEVQALLSLSERLAKRVGLVRNVISGGDPGAVISIPEDAELATASRRAIFSLQDLQEAGIERDQLEPFVFRQENRCNLSGEWIGNSTLERYPLLESGADLVFALPTATSASLRRHVLERLKHLGQFRTFCEVLRKKQRQNLFLETLLVRKAFRNESGMLPSSNLDPRIVSEAAVQFDAGKFAHFVLLHDDIGGILDEGLTSFQRFPEQFQQDLADHLDRSAKSLASRTGYIGGLTVVVLGGLGRGFGFVAPKLPNDWEFLVWTLPDLVQLNWLEEEWVLKLWKLHHQAARLRDVGVCFGPGTEHVNLFAFWRENRWRLVPLMYEFGKQRGDIMLNPGFVSSFRQAGRMSYDEHAVFKAAEGRWVPVRKKIAKGYFREIEAQPVYVSPDHAVRAILSGLIETSTRAWWVECVTSPSNPRMRDLGYRIWECALSWMEKLAPQLDDDLPTLPPGNIQLDLSLDCLSHYSEASEIVSTKANDTPPVEFAKVSQNRATIKINPGLFRLLARPENDGERELVRTSIRAACDLAGVSGQSLTDVIVAKTVPNSKARFVHLIPAQNVRDEIAYFDRPDARFLEQEDFRFVALGEAWLARSRGETEDVLGRDECVAFLNRVVGKTWENIRKELSRFDRKALVEKCLRNIEGLKLDEAQWRQTAQAVLAVYRERDDVVRAASDREKERARASIASRVLVEMAVCACPEAGGRTPGNAELDSLIAHVAVLIATAYDSDAVYHGLTEPKVRICPNGELEVVEDFFDEVVYPYQFAFHSERFLSHATEYGELFKTKRGGRAVEEVFGASFIEAFEAEYRLPLRQMVRVDETLQDHAVDQRSMVTAIKVGELSRLLKDSAGLTQQGVESLFTNFGLWPRNRWEIPPRRFRAKDLQPWRFRRPLSLLARPLVLLGSSPDDHVLYAAGLVHDAFAYMVVSSYEGRFDQEYFQTDEMKSWIGSANNRKGHEFNEQVSDEFRKNGFHARASVRMSEFNPPAELGDLGDVDVLAWSDEGLVYVVECKSLRFAMTIGEIAEQLRRFRGEANDELHRHLKRVKWLQGNQESIGNVLGVQNGVASLRSLLVTNTIVPMQFKNDLPISAKEIIPFSQLRTTIDEREKSV